MGNSPRTFEDPQFVLQDLLSKNSYSLEKMQFNHPLRDDYKVRFGRGSNPVVAELRMEFQDRQHVSKITVFYRDGQQDKAMPVYRLVGSICDQYLVPFSFEQGTIPVERVQEVPTVPKEESSLEHKVNVPDVLPQNISAESYQSEDSEKTIH